jgi:hypothetical protein
MNQSNTDNTAATADTVAATPKARRPRLVVVATETEQALWDATAAREWSDALFNVAGRYLTAGNRSLATKLLDLASQARVDHMTHNAKEIYNA